MTIKTKLIAALKIWVVIYPSITCVSVLLWRNIISVAFGNTNSDTNNSIGTLDSICWPSICEFNDWDVFS